MPHHQPNNLEPLVPAHEQELSSNNLRQRMMDEFLELLEMMQDELQEWKSMPDSPASSLPHSAAGPRSSGSSCLSLLPGVQRAGKVAELTVVRKRKGAEPRELRAGSGPERGAAEPPAKRPRRQGRAEAEETKEEGQRQSVPRACLPLV